MHDLKTHFAATLSMSPGETRPGAKEARRDQHGFHDPGVSSDPVDRFDETSGAVGGERSS
jgi:hypothetical protein